MCVILQKEPTKEIPYDILLASAYRNTDGYGVVIPDGSALVTTKGLSKSPEHAADSVAKILDDNKGTPAFIHFRLRTVGDLSLNNAQPIEILKKNKGDDEDLTFMHNGTITKLGKYNEGKSDSIIFAERVLEPLVRRSIAYSGIDNVLDDPLLGEILAYYGPLSRYALIDGKGNSLIVNRKEGEERDWGWASNGYSIVSSNIKRKSDKKDSKVIYPSAWDTKFKSDICNNKGLGRKSDELCHPEQRMTVKDCTGFDLREFRYLDENQLRELVDEEPDLATLLLLDYAHALAELEDEKVAA